MTDDAILVTRTLAGSEEAFVALVARYERPLLRFLIGMLGDRMQAEDALQETFIKAYRALPQLADPAALRPWLYRIASNQALMALRRQRLLRWVPLLRWRAVAAAPEHATVEQLNVAAALARVPPEQRTPLLLHVLGGLSHAEIGALLEISENAARMRVSRGRAAFRTAYQTEDDDETC